MAIISQETFDKFTEGEKEKIRKEYLSDKKYNDDRYFEGSIDTFEVLFGKENLQPKPEIKTWKNIEENYNEYYKYVAVSNSIEEGIINIEDKLRLKLLATYRITKLIELGYGGMVTDEEWRNRHITKWIVVPNDDNGNLIIVNTWYNSRKSCIAFHKESQAEEFMSYLENVKLVEQYNMI